MLRRPRDARDGKECDVTHRRAFRGSPLTRPAGSCAFTCRAELRFAAAVPHSNGVLRYAPNALLPADCACFARGFISGARRALRC